MDCKRRPQCNLTIMQQIEELKNWHQQQQKIIHQPTVETKSDKLSQSLLSVDCDDVYDFSDMDKKHGQTRFENKVLGTQKTIQDDTITPQNEKNYINIDELPIHTANTDFNKLVENSVKTSKLYDIPSVQAKKHKFLKKGEGTARFGMVPGKPYKKYPIKDVKITIDSKQKKFLKKPVLKNISDKSCNKSDAKNKDVFENQKNSVEPSKSPEQTEMKSTSWKSVFTSAPQQPKSGDEYQLNVSSDSVMLSFIEKILSLDEASKRECEELKIFELLEQRALDSSFSSNSSIFTRIMENSVKSTPVKHKPSSGANLVYTKNINYFSNHDKNTINTNVCTPPVDTYFDFIDRKLKKQTVEPINNNSLHSGNTGGMEEQVKEPHSNELPSDNNQDMEESLHVRFAENDSYRSFGNDTCSGMEECTEIQEDDDTCRRHNPDSFDDNEEWSGGDCDCPYENNTEYSSSEEDCRPVSPPSPVSETIRSNNKPRNANRKTTTKNISKLEGDKDSDYRVHYVTSNNATSEKASGTSYDITAELKTADTSIKNNDVIRRSVIEARLKELETEIETFRSENNKLRKLRSEYDQEYKKFQNEKKEFLKHLNEEKSKIAADLEEERRKLAKEKLVFEKYSKTVSRNPSKQERAEILGLKQKLTELQEEMNKKESRWGASQARFRNQMRQLEEDNKRLKDEIEQIKKTSTCNHHISSNHIQDKPISNTQLIHIINKQLSNLGIKYIHPDHKEDSIQFSKHVKHLGGSKISEKNKKLKKESKGFTKLNVCIDSQLEGSDSDTYFERENDLVKETVYTATIKPVCDSENIVSGADKHVVIDKICKNTTEFGGYLKGMCESNEENTFNSETVKEIILPEGKEIIKEMVFPDGRKEIYYPNGNTKKINPSGDVTKIIYFNGDVKETSEDGTIKYYYAESKVWHTTYPDGLEVLDFPDGLVEQRCKSGIVNITYPNGSKKIIYPDSSEEWIYPDGSTMKINLNNDKILTLPNGQKEVHTKEHMRREYPDGTIKFVYPDGTQETRYSNGRIRLKDKSGNLVMDSG